MNNVINVELNNIIGKIKPMHGTGGGPRQGGASLGANVTDIFQEIGVPFCRLHDIEGGYAQNQYVDVHCVFPDFNADENDPDSYNFKPTDNYLNYIIQSGSKVFYRLGETIDHYPKKLFVRPPKDYYKWARICEHIIRHYNEGWANGFEWNIEHWEIWNEPDNFRMWTGDFDEFYNLYVVTAKHLKSCFPNLKIGGYSASGFYTETRPIEKCGEWFRTLVPYTIKFFERLSNEQEKVPMDFFSWHCYANRPEEIKLFAEFAQRLLDKYGYSGIDSYLTEYNTLDSLKYATSTLPYYGAELGAGLIVAQNSPVDAVMYYDMRFTGMNGIFAKNKYMRIERLHGFYALKSFGDLYRLGNQCKVDNVPAGVYALVAKDNNKVGIMLSVRDFEGQLSIKFNENIKECEVKEFAYEKDCNILDIEKVDFGIKFTVQKDTIYYIDITI